MAEGNYPKSEQQVSDALVESKILRAKAAWLDVYQALDSVHEKLNVQIPFLDKA
jgi:ribosome-associated translation inhibitor RaiA